MQCEQRLNWLMLAMICPLIAATPLSMSKSYGSCPEENLNITGGSFDLSNGYSDGSFLRYICPDGYYPSVQSRRCQYGLWTPKTSTRKHPECKKVTCPNPRVLKNGQVTPKKDRYYVNDTTTYSCHSDYKFHGSAIRVCKPNGKWSGSTPICGHDSDHCPDPGVPPGSSRTGNMFNIDDKVTYRCDSKLTLIGSKERVCQDGGQWSGTEPQCYADFTYDTPEEVAESFSSSLKSNLAVSEQYEGEEQHGKKITLDQDGKLDIYIAVDASGSISETEFIKAKNTVKKLIDKISYYQVSPNYEILIFATDSIRIISMRDYKTNEDARNLMDVFKTLDEFRYGTNERTGTNIAKVYDTILESMTAESVMDQEGFLETQNIIIMFTDGQANMGGNPKPKVEKIKKLITKNDPKREKNLDLYVFGIGEVNKEGINDLVSHRDKEQYFFWLSDLDEVQKMFDIMLDESTSVGLCGIHQDYDNENKRRAYPWLAQISVTHSSKSSNCMGSLVTSTHILTAAACFKEGVKPDNIIVTLGKDQAVKVKEIILHPDYNITAKQHMGIKEYYEFDAALIQLETAVTMSVNLRPICIPCTKETNGALKLSDSEGTCKKHEDLLLSSELVEAAFTTKMETGTDVPKKIKNITIKRGKYRDACVEDAKSAAGKSGATVKDVVTDNFLCSGGTEPQTDDISCKGESGGATHVNRNGRLIQVGVVSWGVKDICSKSDTLSEADSRDYHTNLFSDKIQSFLKEHLGNDAIDHPLSFF